MRNLKVFPKMFLQTFTALAGLTIITHLLIYLIFPQNYLETRYRELSFKANQISNSIQGKDTKFIEQVLDFYSQNSEIKVSIKENHHSNQIQIKDSLKINPLSDNNSLIIEEREVKLSSGQTINVQFVSTADMQKDAKDLSIKFLPYSLLTSCLLSIMISLVYAKMITKNIQEIKGVTKQMMQLDRNAKLKVDSTNEIGQLKEQINNLYTTLLRSIDDLEIKNREILRLEKLKDDFFRGASHELKTPLASLKIILENMKYGIGKYQNKELYIDNCLKIVDDLAQNISQILTVSSLEYLKNDQEKLIINGVLQDVLEKYKLLANKKKITINNYLTDERIYIGKSALKIVLSNLISNAIKYSDETGIINIGVKSGWLYIENSYSNKNNLDISKISKINFDLNKEDSNGLGLYIIKNILLNYKIKHKLEISKIGVIFSIKLPRL
ncbi:MAG: HAMP domain-containing sensor histidine kinase [Candidatus Saccharibacteria bacterium]|nr:HAMP domain-containing sensor histidine kinase [Candidatus Saccharibacteria bacterium]